MLRATGMGNGGGGDDGGTAIGHGFGVLVVVIKGLVKAAKDGEDSMNPMMVVSDGGDGKR
jgi:hypothetical protein